MRLLLLLLFFLWLRPAAGQGLYELVFTEVTEDVHVASRPDVTRLPVHGNVTLIFNEADVVVVDAGASLASARQIVAYIRARTSNPVSVVVNTHGHEDHILGNQVFLEAFPGVEIVARQETHDYLASGRVQGRVDGYRESLTRRRTTGEAEVARLEERGAPGDDAVIAHVRRFHEQDMLTVAEDYADIRVTLPTLTFEDRLVLRRSGRTIEVLDLGPGKSGSAAIVYLPEERLVVAGDVVVHPFPYGFARDPAGWLATLNRLAALDSDLLIPGHGAVLHGDTYLRQLIALLEFGLEAVEEAVAAGLNAETTRAQLDFSEWQERFVGLDPVLGYRFGTWFIEPFIERAHRALAAAPDDS